MKRLTSRKGEQGVTLVELMIVVGILGMVMAATYNMFNFQQKSYTIQDNVAVMQQNVRVGLDYMVKEVRMAGYIPEDIPPFNAGPTDDTVPGPPAGYTPDGNNEAIEEATFTTLTFQADIDDDNRTETVRYALDGTNLTRAVWEWSGGSWTDEDGLADPQIVAEDIVTITFAYIGVMPNGLDDDNDGTVDNDDVGVFDIAGNNIDDDNDGTNDEDGALNTTGLRGGIRQIRISMTAIAQSPDADYTHPQFGDHFRRRTLTSNAYLRNP